MASSEGQTELLSGWSCVVHQPSEDPEPSELPSTVDITAFSAGISVEPVATTTPAIRPVSESDSESESASHGSGSGSGSCSASDSSDSDSSSSSTSSRSRSPSPEFSVTSQSPGLRITIANVRKIGNEQSSPGGECSKDTKIKDLSSSDSDDSSDSDTSVSTETKSNKGSPIKSAPVVSATVNSNPDNKNSAPAQIRPSRVRRGLPAPSEKKVERKNVVRKEVKDKDVSPRVLRERARLKRKKMAALPTSRSSTHSSSDSQDSDNDSVMLSSNMLCSLQEIRQEDLAAILPDQQECDAFDAFEENAKSSPQTGDASASDIELPQQAVNAIIQRTTESYSESESHPPPSTNLFANSLIQQFHIVNSGQEIGKVGGKPGETDKKKRGRPKKAVKKEVALEYCGDPNVSPDSGIQNSPDHVSSSECSPPPQMKIKYADDKTKLDKKQPLTKMTVTSNRFDRILYGHSDRVLYPPRRKVGRPVSKKGPGRPPKNKSCENKPKSPKNTETKTKGNSKKKEVLQTSNRPAVGRIEKCKEKTSHLNEICERISKRLEDKTKVVAKPKVVLAPKTKKQFLTVKNEKLMHSKHKHKKHKKCKFMILKPLSASQPVDPKLTLEVDKLVGDFYKLCCISPMGKQTKDYISEGGKTLKKVSKKRKVSDSNDRKKKKVVEETTSPNEQRLPLKKRHYHLTSTNSVASVDSKDKEEVRKGEGEGEGDTEGGESNEDSKFVNNNEYALKTSHIDEAIEACIHKYAGVATSINQDKIESAEVETPDDKPMTTPKKRHRLEQFSPELLEIDENEEGLEAVVNEIRMKRSLSATNKRTSDLVASIRQKKSKLDELTSNLSSKLLAAEELRKKPDLKDDVKLLVSKKVKPFEEMSLSVAVNEKPTGIFLPTVDLEAMEPIAPAVKEIPKVRVEPVAAVAKHPNIKEVKRKVRKRRAINRTGFPTVKKKKKKVAVSVIQTPVVCDRVPKDGEEYSSFVERTEMPKPDDNDEDDEMSGVQWDAVSECDSLPQEDRIDFDIKAEAERFSMKSRNDSPMTTSSIEDAPLQDRLVKLRRSKKLEKNLKHLRDLSPASRESSASGDDVKRAKKAPRWRKKYLSAGLFSDYYKEDDLKRQDVSKKLQYVPEEHPYGLLPAPYHCGKYLRCRKISFQLPYDLWWQHTNSQLPGRDLVPSWNYRKIRSNVYNIKNTLNACEPQSCNCSPTSNCGDDCINRLVLAECPASHKCNNQRIQRHEWAPGLERFMTESKGWGIRTNDPIKSGEFILEYVGEVVSDQEFKERMATRYVHDTHHYCLHLDGGIVIDGHRMGGDGRFVNHSCEPNCEIQKWSVNGQFRMVLFSLRDIEEGEELAYDYNFSLFNPADGQECKCGSEDCRGVIGGKSQRVRQSQAQAMQNAQGLARVGRPRKTQAKKAASSAKISNSTTQQANSLVVPQIKISTTLQLFIKEHHCFLLRNLKKIKKLRDRSVGSSSSVPRAQTATPTNQGAAFLNQLNALRQPRNMITRRVAQAEDDPELKKTVHLANFLRNIYNTIVEAKDENGEKLCTPFVLCPVKRKQPDYYQKVLDPIDLTTIEQTITSGTYKSFESFDNDINKLFNNAIRFYGRSDNIGIASARLKKIYNESKAIVMPEIEGILGVKPPTKCTSNKKKNEEEDIIRCICGMYKDEGLMIQCERCLVWQHCECVKADDNAPSYHCEQCVPRVVDYEIALDEYTEHNHRYYMTLMRGDLQLRQGDTVYVLRDISIPGTEKKHTYDTIGDIKYSDLDIFRIERLWKDSKTGQRFAYGHHYLRPHETYHEPSRKFFPNEVMRVPLYEAVPVELIISHCWVMDLNTYCKGRPIGAPEEHIYICEYRVDKNARLFSKVSKSKFPICCKSYAFEKFPERRKYSRSYTPHDLDPAFLKQRGRKPTEISEEAKSSVLTNVEPVIKTVADKKGRVNAILLKLLSKLPTKQPLDVTYLLEGGRRRKNRDDKNKI